MSLFADPRPLPADYWQDVAPAVPVTTRSRVRTDVEPHRVTLFPDPTPENPLTVGAEELRMRELWRMHAAPHLYERWMRDLHDDLHAQSLGPGQSSYDCNRCRMTVVVNAWSDPCPRCGQ